MTSPAPIGVFDSGFGGLSVLRAIRSRLPSEDLIYCADHAWMPWGERDPDVVRARCRHIAGGLIDAGVRALVIACNTATAAAADDLRAAFDLPVIGMEPAVKPAATATRSGIVGILGTGGTLASSRFSALLERYGSGLEVITRPAPELVTAVERDNSETRRELVVAAVEPLLARGADVIVLGCTHFPFLRAEIEAVAGRDVTIIDTGTAVARELERRVQTAGSSAPHDRKGHERFWTTGDVEALTPTLQRLWGSGRVEAMPAALPGLAE
ncbi:glutamate racemase [Halofilum ochraceum]|uniref:glutamate racemase n=1 Tax=Halofilum ochraceum TaxID=1611323 RepID=UPI00082F0B6A|nr:glutamate racemase [Halofilum ochraceum]